MKKILLITLLLIVGCSSDKEPINTDELDAKDGIFYMKDTNKPYSGKFFSLYEVGGQKREEGSFKYGKLDGLWTGWHENGQKKYEITHKDGEFIDGTSWDEDGYVWEPVDYEKTNDEWFNYYNITDLSIMNKLSEIMKQGKKYPVKEYRTNEDQLNDESRTGYNSDGILGTSFTPQYWSKISLYPNGKGKLLKGVKQNPWYPIQYKYEIDIVWFLQLSPSPLTVDKTWKPSEHIYDYLFYKWEDRTEMEPLSFITDKFSRKEKMDLFSVVDRVKNNFMSKNKYIINKNGYFVKSEDSWKKEVKNGEWKEWSQYSKYENNRILKSDGKYKDGVKDDKWTFWYENGQKKFEKTYKDGKKDGIWTSWDRDGNVEKIIDIAAEIAKAAEEARLAEGSTYLSQKLELEQDLHSRIENALSKILDDQLFVWDVTVDIKFTPTQKSFQSEPDIEWMEISCILPEGLAPELIENVRQIILVESRFDRSRGDILSLMTALFK